MDIKYQIVKNRINLYFLDDPSENVVSILKSKGWKWDGKNKCWTNNNSAKSFRTIELIINKYNNLNLNTNNGKGLNQKLINTICKYTEYNNSNIKISQKAGTTCCNGIKLINDKGLLTISDDKTKIIVPGFYCPRCHNLFFKTKTVNNTVTINNRHLLDMPFIMVNIKAYNSLGKRTNLTPIDQGELISYKEKYNKNIKMYLIMKSFVEGKDIARVQDILERYGYSLDMINSLPYSTELDTELCDYFKCESINDLCFISADTMKSELGKCIDQGNLEKVYLNYNDEKDECSVAFRYKITPDFNLIFHLPCLDIYGDKDNFRLEIIDQQTIKVDFKCKGTSSVYTYTMKDYREGYSMLIRKNQFKRLKSNVKKGFFDDSEYYLKNNVNLLDVADFLVRSTYYGCTNNKHKLIRINAAVKVKSKNNIYEVIIPAAYCEKCNRYYILEAHYNVLKKYGYICCRIDTFESLQKVAGNMFSTFQEKSILSWYGYNVKQQDDLSDDERHRILDFIIGNHIQTSYEVINRLEQNIALRKNNPLMIYAIEKWEKDIEYIRKNQKAAGLVKVNSIKVPVKKNIMI